jgi:predicted DNA-binding protein with PD1-like motif
VHWKLLHEHQGERTVAIVLDTGDDVLNSLDRAVRDLSLGAASFTAIGAFERVVLGFFDLDARDYRRIPVDEQVEVVSLVGDVTRESGEPKLHAHVVVAKRDGTAHGGHLLEARVRPTLEIMLVESPSHLERRFDPATGLSLISLTSAARR